MRDAYLSTLYDLTKNNKQVMALVADIGAIVYDKYRADFPNNFINFGVAEANLIGASAGLASCGKIPFVYTIAPFITMRVYEQIKNDICLQNMNVKIVGVGAGFVYSTLGPTHHAIEDIAIMKVLPNMTIICPADPLEAQKATRAAAEIVGPVYLRLGTSNEPKIYQEDYAFSVGRGVRIKEGKDATIIATGSIVNDALLASKELEKEGIDVRVINLHTIKPIDKEIILKAAYETRHILTLEEHSIEGGLGSSISAIILEECDVSVKFKRMGLKDCFCSYFGTHQELKTHYGLSKNDIMKEVRNILSRKTS